LKEGGINDNINLYHITADPIGRFGDGRNGYHCSITGTIGDIGITSCGLFSLQTNQSYKKLKKKGESRNFRLFFFASKLAPIMK